MPHILFVCTANLYRSPLAAAFLYRKLQTDRRSEGWVVESAGTWAVPGHHVPEQALMAARDLGLDLQSHLTRQVDRDLLAGYDLILVMERGHMEALTIEFPFIQKKLHLLSEVADQLQYDIADPASSGLRISEIAAQMCNLIERAYPNICLLAQTSEVAKPSAGRHVNYTL
jgi:protein-tyrosine phosphatase